VELEPPPALPDDKAPTYRMIFSYSKIGPAVFLSHLSVIEVFFAALQRAGIPAAFTEGFNPMPKLNFASPLSLGISGENEIASIDLTRPLDEAAFVEELSAALPEGLRIRRALCVKIPYGAKKVAAPSVLWGFAYKTCDDGLEYVAAAAEKKWREEQYANGKTPLDLTRRETLAMPPPAEQTAVSGSCNYQNYFDFYKSLYGT
jgi:radical SAM-linked protein